MCWRLSHSERRSENERGDSSEHGTRGEQSPSDLSGRERERERGDSSETQADQRNTNRTANEGCQRQKHTHNKLELEPNADEEKLLAEPRAQQGSPKEEVPRSAKVGSTTHLRIIGKFKRVIAGLHDHTAAWRNRLGYRSNYEYVFC